MAERPSRIDTTQGGAALLPLTYGFDVDGKIASIADNGGVRNFTCDPTLQLTGGGYASARFRRRGGSSPG